MKLKNDGSESIIIEIGLDLIESQCRDTTSEKVNRFYVYVLIDPITKVPFYVGKGYGDRDRSHIQETSRGVIPHGNKHLYYKIKKILSNGKHVIIERLEVNLQEDISFLREAFYIKKWGRKDLGLGPLLNLTDGGEGQSGWIPDKAYKERMSVATSGENNGMFGKKHSDETKQKMREKASKRLFTPSMRKTWSEVKKGNKNSFYGKHHSEETKKRIRYWAAKNAIRGKANSAYVNLDPIRYKLIDIFIRTKNYSETVRYANSCGIRCSRTAVKRRLKEWIVLDIL